MEDEVVELFVGEDRVRRDEAEALGFGADLRSVEAAPVVCHLDDDVATLVERGERDRPFVPLARRTALVGPLEPVIDRVPDEVRQRVDELLDHALVDLGPLALDLEPTVSAVSRTRRGKRRNTVESGTIRIAMTRSWSSRV